MAYWAYGLNDQGEPQLLGPFEDEGEAQDAGAELNRVQMVSAPTRDAAIRQLQRSEQRSRRTEKPAGRQYAAGFEPDWEDEMNSEYSEFEREMSKDIG